MPDDTARRFRDRAMDCRNLAKGASTECDAAMLEELAAELEEEARKVEAESISGGESQG